MTECNEQDWDERQKQLDELRAKVNAAKIAYLNRTPFLDKSELTYEDLKKVAQEFIRASYQFQKQKYGSIKVRISVAKLLRR
jgi:hypothetical protein